MIGNTVFPADDPDNSLLNDPAVLHQARSYEKWQIENQTILKTPSHAVVVEETNSGDMTHAGLEEVLKDEPLSQQPNVFTRDLPRVSLQTKGTILKFTIRKVPHPPQPLECDNPDSPSEVTNSSWVSEDDSITDDQILFTRSGTESDVAGLFCSKTPQIVRDGQCLRSFAGPPRYRDEKGLLQQNLRKEGKLPLNQKERKKSGHSQRREVGKGLGSVVSDLAQQSPQTQLPPPTIPPTKSKAKKKGRKLLPPYQELQ